MTATSGSQLHTGFRHAVIFELDTNGYPAASGTTAYEGWEVVGPKAYSLNIPDVRKITHVGADRALALDFLPPIEAMSAELRVASEDLPLNAVLSAVKTFTVGEATLMPMETDQQGAEPTVSLLLYQQSLDTSTKLRNWRFHIIPRARVVPMPSGMDENAGETRYAIAPSPSTKHVWGTALATGTEGATESGVLIGQSEARPIIVSFKGDSSTVDFLFPTDKPATDTAKIKVWVDGVLTVPSVVAVTGFTLGSAPGTGVMVVAYYEY